MQINNHGEENSQTLCTQLRGIIQNIKSKQFTLRKKNCNCHKFVAPLLLIFSDICEASTGISLRSSRNLKL